MFQRLVSPAVGYFRVVLCLFFKAGLAGAEPFISKRVNFARKLQRRLERWVKVSQLGL